MGPLQGNRDQAGLARSTYTYRGKAQKGGGMRLKKPEKGLVGTLKVVKRSGTKQKLAWGGA